jgi:TolB protein
MRVDLPSAPQQLTHDDFADIGPSWSPDGTRIAFHSSRELVDNEIFVVNADGSGLRRITTNELPDENPAWAPDAVHIVFQSGRRDATQLIVLNADTGRDRIELTPPGRDYVPDW